MSRRPKRPSVKGKGADIFFRQDEAPAPEPVERGPTDEDPGQLASVQASTQADADGATEDANSDIIIFDDAMERVARTARVTASFRFTEAELQDLDDVVSAARTRHRARVPKQDVVRLALATLLSEYEERGEHSVLARYFQMNKQR